MDVAYVVSFCAILCWWRNSLSVVLAFLLTLGHTVGAATWLIAWYHLPGVVAALGVAVTAERLLNFSWRQAATS
jgi:hypothetical protein